MSCRIPLPWTLVFCLLAGPAATRSQTPDTPIFEQGTKDSRTEADAAARRLLALRETHALLDKPAIDSQLKSPKPAPLQLPAASRKTHSTEELATICRQASLRAGYLYLCTKCDKWHLSTAGAYAITNNVIATCDHVLEKSTEMKEGYFVVLSDDGRFAAATAILARSKTMDIAIVRVAGDDLEPTPLQTEVRQGASAFCFSHPLRQQGYFSTGIVNRFYWNASYAGQDKDSIDALQHLRIDLSTEWAPGSSGSPLLDQSGNVVAHVSTIAGLGSNKGKNGPYLTLHTGIPARCVKRLVALMDQPGEIERLASLEPPGKPAKPAEKTPPASPPKQPEKTEPNGS